MKNHGVSRRQFLRSTSVGLAAAGVASRTAEGNPDLGSQATAPGPTPPTAKWVDLDTLKSLHIWDGHCHLAGFPGSTPGERMQTMLRYADRMGIERMCVFLGMELKFHGGPQAMRKQNDEVMEAVKHSNGRALGYAFMDPDYVDDCLDEINRCVRDGPMVGLKIEFDTPKLADSPELDAIIARAGELKAVVMHHTYIKTTGNMPGESTPAEVAALARRHPSTTIICGHTGGSTWELGIPPLRGLRNVYADLSGSDPTAGFTEMAVQELGADRVMYGSDVAGRGFASQLGKVMGARIPPAARPLIMGENLRRVLQPILTAKGMPF